MAAHRNEASINYHDLEHSSHTDFDHDECLLSDSQGMVSRLNESFTQTETFEKSKGSEDRNTNRIFTPEAIDALVDGKFMIP